MCCLQGIQPYCECRCTLAFTEINVFPDDDDPSIIIAQQERQYLVGLKAPIPDLAAILGDRDFIRIKAIASFWQGRAEEGYLQHAIELAIAAHGYNDHLTFVMCGDRKSVSVYLAVDSDEVASHLLRSAYPGIILEERHYNSLGLDLVTHFRYAGMITGVPAPPQVGGQQPQQGEPGRFHFERIIRGMRGARWVYVVQAFPRPGEEQDERQNLLMHMSQLASSARQQVQRTIQESISHRNRETQSASEVRGSEIVDRRADYGVELLERALKRSERAVAIGRWQTAVLFGAETQSNAVRLGSLLASILSGPESRPSPIRVHSCSDTSTEPIETFHTYLDSEEMALEIVLPREEVPGLAIVDYAPFDVCVSTDSTGIRLGDVLWDDRRTTEQYHIAVDDLTRHGVVFGVTGSGKTTTLLGLLSNLVQPPQSIPFLVIEPAKTEYRGLLGSIRDGKPDGEIPQLRVYTLGNDTVAPFRLNPFEFDLPKIYAAMPVLSHIDFLKAVFNAAFILYAPMPYVLDMALHEIYEDKGWNLATGINVRLPPEDWSKRELYPIFPSLTDLYQKVEAVTKRLGYESKVEQDVVAGLKARVGSLRLGAKGLMLDTPRGIPMDELLSRPVVLELESIGNDDEKTFIMGLLLARLYGFRRLQAVEGGLTSVLKHVLIIEEAHRLLKNTSTTVESDSANLRAQAIETFINMLSEVRHYGQGVLVAEQIPTKLTPDVIKNTNLKVIHRLLAQDDRELVGRTMNMTEGQIRRLAWLTKGQAAVFAEGDDHPLLIEVENFRKRHPFGPPGDDAVSARAESYIVLSSYLRVPRLVSYGIRLGSLQRPDPIIYQEVIQQLARDDSAGLWARLLLQIVFARKALPSTIDQLRRSIATGTRQLNPGQYTAALQMSLVLGADAVLQNRGAERGWSFSAVDALRDSLTSGLVRLARTSNLQDAAADLDRFARAYERRMRDGIGPFPGCRHCRAPCLYRMDVGQLTASSDKYAVRAIIGDVGRPRDERFVALATMLRETVNRWVDGAGTETDNMSYCMALGIAPTIGMDPYEQDIFAQEVAAKILV